MGHGRTDEQLRVFLDIASALIALCRAELRAGDCPSNRIRTIELFSEASVVARFRTEALLNGFADDLVRIGRCREAAYQIKYNLVTIVRFSVLLAGLTLPVVLDCEQDQVTRDAAELVEPI